MMEPDILEVVFRRWPEAQGGDVIALFPNMAETDEYNADRVMSYQHVGQHGAADYAHVVNVTRPATLLEFAPLLAELSGIYAPDCVFQVCQRRPKRREA